MVSLFDSYSSDTPKLWTPPETPIVIKSHESLVTAFEDDNASLASTGKAFRDGLQQVLDRSNVSITNFIKKMIVTSRVYIQRSIADDPSLDDNLACIKNQYLAFILAALGLNNSIIGNRTVRELVNVVASEQFDSCTDFKSIEDVAYEAFGFDMKQRTEYRNNRERDTTGHKRDIDKIKFKDKLDRERDSEKYDRDTQRDQTKFDREDARIRADNKREDDRNTIKDKREDDRSRKSEAGVNKESRELSLASGSIVEFTFEGPQGKIKINIPVHLIPKIVPDEVAEQFVSLNFSLDFRKRWLQVQAGEKSFIKDFLLQLDVIKKKNEALKKDTDNVLFDMLSQANNKAGKNILALAKSMALDVTKSQNMANTVLIYDKQSFMQYANNVGVRWNNPSAREAFFKKTMSFMVVLIDPVYDMSEYYWSGFDFVGEYSSKQLKAAKAKGSYDLKDIMTAFNQGTNPKF